MYINKKQVQLYNVHVHVRTCMYPQQPKSMYKVQKLIDLFDSNYGCKLQL